MQLSCAWPNFVVVPPAEEDEKAFRLFFVGVAIGMVTPTRMYQP